MSKRFALCPLCYGVHKLLACAGRPQSEREWMIDRGVREERADEILVARARFSRATGHAYPPMVTLPDPRVLNVEPFGAPPRQAPPAPAPAEIQESLF